MSYLEGLELYSAHKYSKSMKVFKQLLTGTHPDDVITQSTLHSNISQIELALDLSRRSLTSANKAIALYPSNIHAYIAKANCYGKQSDYDSSVNTLQECMKILVNTPCDIQLYNCVKGELGCYKKIQENILAGVEMSKFEKKVISRKEIKVQEPDKNKIKVDTEHTALDETSRIVWLKIEQGHGMCREGKLVEAIELYTEVVNEEDIKPIYKLLAYLSRGTVLGHLKKLEDAYNDFSKVLKMDDKNIEALKRRGQVRSQLKDFSGAKNDLKEARRYLAEKGEKDIEIEKEMALFLYKEGKYNEGLEALRNAELINKEKASKGNKGEETESSDADIFATRSLIYNSLGMFMEAEKSANEALELMPESIIAFENLAKSMKEQQKYEKAEKYFLKSIQIDPSSIRTYNLLAILRFSLAKLPGTIEIADRGLEIDDNFTDLLYLKGCSYHGLGQFKLAIEWYQKVLKLNKDHWSFYHIDLARFHQTNFDVPLTSWNLDRHFSPDFKERWSKREPSSKLDVYVGQTHPDPNALPLELGQKLDPQLQMIQKAAFNFKTKIQYHSPGFTHNEKQHKQSGIAILQMAQVAQHYWNACKTGEILQTHDNCKSATQIQHSFCWRDFFDIAVSWRQISEPSDPVWWIDMLCEKTFVDGYGASTPILMGESQNIRYYQYHDRIISLIRELLPEQFSLTGAEKHACFEAKNCANLYQIIQKDFYVHTNCTRLSDPNSQPLEGTRLTIQQCENGYILSIRTPCTPDRWKMFDVEMELAWQNLAQTIQDGKDVELILKDILVLVFYWYNFMPLVRGTALCGLVAIHGLLLATGFEVKGKIPDCLQIDWEAVLSKNPDLFITSINRWLVENVVAVEQGFLENVPSIESNIDTLRKAYLLLNDGLTLV